MERIASLAWVTAIGRPPPKTHPLKACEFSPSPILMTPIHPKLREVHAAVPVASTSIPGERLDDTALTLPKWDGKAIDSQHLLGAVKFSDAGLVPAIAQQWDTGEVLMMAWMNAESIKETMKGGRAVYYSRSRKQLWRKGDVSGQIQVVRDLLLDCDGDTILLKVDQLGVACHTGRRSCFFTAYRPPNGEASIIADVLMDPKELYKADR